MMKMLIYSFRTTDFRNMGKRHKIATLSLLFVILPILVSCEYDDVRCKCVCPRAPGQKQKNITIVTTTPELCTCSHVLKREETYCLRCECKYETRNTLMIKVIVCAVLISFLVLFLYMAIIMIQKHMKPQPISVTSDEVQAQLLNQPTTRQHRKRMSSVGSELNTKLTDWTKVVDEQRDNVYRKNTMLNWYVTQMPYSFICSIWTLHFLCCVFIKYLCTDTINLSS